MAVCIQRIILSTILVNGLFSKFIIADNYFNYDLSTDDGFSTAVDNPHHIQLREVAKKDFDVPTDKPPISKPARVLPVAPTINPEDDYSDVGLTLPPDKQKSIHNHHYYYNSTFYMEPEKWHEYWVNLDSTNEKTTHQVVLSNAYRKGITINLSFDFPFYGHLLRNITVTTGGFLFTGEQVHSWLAATQYIAPLMANFDPSLTNDSLVKYADNGTAFTVQWENVQLKDKKFGNFTFQVTLLSSGDIIFVYREIPVSVMNINDDEHPVKVGLSDAYIIDRTIFFLRRKTIYEYHRVDLRKPDISNSTSIYFKALPTCVSIKDCHGCMSAKIGFECIWCIGRCSDGMDRNRQSWIMEGCGQQSEEVVCPKVDFHTDKTEAQKSTTQIEEKDGVFSEANIALTSPLYFSTAVVEPVYMTLSTTYNVSTSTVIPHNRVSDQYYQGNVDYYSLSTAGVVIILFVVTMVLAFVGWVFYAYKHPQTPSGQLLIKYRPTQWSWPKGEARYTAASIHM